MRAAAATSRLRALLAPSRQKLRYGAAAAAGLTAVGGCQGLYLWGQYRELPEARGPLHGVATYLREKREDIVSRVQQPPATSDAAASPAPRPLLTLTRGAAAFSASSPSEALPRKNILFIGDSLVTGVGCQQDGTEAGKGPTLPRRTAEFLSRCACAFPEALLPGSAVLFSRSATAPTAF